MLKETILEFGALGMPAALAACAVAFAASMAALTGLERGFACVAGGRAARLLARAFLALHSDAELTRLAVRRGWISSGDSGPRPAGEEEHRIDLDRLAQLREAAEAAGYEYRAARSGGRYTVALIRRDDFCHCSSRSQFRASLTAAELAMGGGPWKLLKEAS